MKNLGRLVLLTIAASGLSFAVQAQGQVAYTAKTANVRAGPARDYPIVAVVPGGYPVAVQGCLPDYTWCDVIAGQSRGWIYGGNVNYSYQNTYVPVLNYGPVIGIGVLAFALDDYWGHHYSNRPWYRERQRWADRRAPYEPRYHRPQDRPYVGGPRPYTRPEANPSGAMLPGQSVPPRQQARRDRANPPGTVERRASVPPPEGTRRDRANPSGAVLGGVPPQ